MIKITVKTIRGRELNKSSVSGVMQGDTVELIQELCAFFEAIEKSKWRDILSAAIDMYISEKIKELEGDDEE